VARGAEELKARFEELRSTRALWEPQWEEIGRLVMPRRMDEQRGFSDTGTPRTRGQILTHRIFDPTASFAAEQLASFLGTQLINPQERWFGLRFRDERLHDDHAAAVWLRTVENLLMAELNAPTSSFHPTMSEVFLDLVTFGSACFTITENAFGRPIFIARPLTEIYVAENADGDVDTIYRRYEWTARQVLQFFGEVPDPLRTRLARLKPAQRLVERIPMLHAVFPREDAIPGSRLASNLPWASVYLCLDPLTLLSEGGFNENPFVFVRWSKTPGDVYGRSPAFTVMPDIRMLQALSKIVIQGAQTRIKKPVMVPDDGFIGPLNLVPGGLSVYRATSRPDSRIIPLDLADDPALGIDFINYRAQNILRAFFVDVIRGISMRGDASPLKATEVIERRNEALQALVPPLTRTQREALAPTVGDRVFPMMFRNGLLPDPPGNFTDAEIEIDFVAPAVIAARIGEAEKMIRAFTDLALMAQLDPAVMRNIDADKWARRVVALRGVSPDLLAPEAAAQEFRDQQERMAQEAQLVAEGAEVAKAVGALQ
jgi:hypothetical protein